MLKLVEMNSFSLLIFLVALLDFGFSVPELTRSVSPVYPPLVLTRDGTTATEGLSVEMVKEASRRVHLSLSFEVQPFARALNTASLEKNVFIFPIIRTPDREVIFEWIGPVNRVEYFLYRLKKSAAPAISQIEQVGDASVGVINRDVIDHFLSAKGMTNIHRTSSIGNLVKMLMSQRIYYLAVPSQTLEYELHNDPASKKEVEKQFLIRGYSFDDFSYIALLKDSKPELVNAMKSALVSMQKDGTWEKIFQSYRY
jgi:polar amino acid transport system substrate-binding protein